jgi:hypothetical protein
MNKGTVALLTIVISLMLAASTAAQPVTATIYEIQQGSHLPDTYVFIDSVVVTSIDLKPNTYGFTAQERDGGPWSGILCYMDAARPDTIDGIGLELGDLVWVRGYYQEYFGVSEIQFEKAHIITEGYGEPEPVLLSCEDLADSTYGEDPDANFGEKWEGVFVAVDTVVVTEHGIQGEWRIMEVHEHHCLDYPDSICYGDTARVDDKLAMPTLPRPGVGDTLALVRGVLSYEWDTYRIWARDDSDLVYISIPPGPNLIIAYPIANSLIEVYFDRDLDETSAENTDNYDLSSLTAINIATLDVGDPKLVHLVTDPQPASDIDVLTVCDVKSSQQVPMDSCMQFEFRAGITPITFVQTPSIQDSSQCVDQQVTIAGIVSTPTIALGGPFYMQDRGGGPWSGMYVYQTAASFNIGDSVVVSGLVDEFYNMTEMVSIDYAMRRGINKPITPTVVEVDSLLVGSPVAEAYECVLVKVDSVEVLTGPNEFGEYSVGHDSVAVPITNRMEHDYPGCGSIIDMTGCLEYAYGAYMIEPRSNADINIIEACTAGIGVEGRFPLRLHQNAPNPFMGTTTVRFSVPHTTRVRLAVYDIAGRLVRVAADKEMTAGEYSLTWDGRDNRGADVGPGIYFCRMATPERVLQNKMVLLK